MKNIGGVSQVLNRSGKVLFNIKEPVTQIKECHEGFIFMNYSEDEKWAFIDTTGKAFSNIRFTNEPENFSQGMSLISNTNGLFGYMDIKGNIVIEPQFVKAFSFTSEYTVVQKTYDNVFQIIDKSGRIINEISGYYPESGVKNGIIKVRMLDRYGFIDIKRKIIIQPEYSQLSDIDSNRIRFKDYDSGEQGYLNQNGEKVIILGKSEY